MKPALKFDRERPTIKIPSGFVLIQDTREQRGLFKDEGILKGKLSHVGLRTGDYSIKGLQDMVAIERKSRIDLFGSLGGGRERFQKEIDRLLKLKWAGLLIQGTESQVMRKQEFSQMSVQSIYGSLCSMEVRGIHIYFAPTKRDGQDWILSRLVKFYNLVRDGEF